MKGWKSSTENRVITPQSKHQLSENRTNRQDDYYSDRNRINAIRGGDDGHDTNDDFVLVENEDIIVERTEPSNSVRLLKTLEQTLLSSSLGARRKSTVDVSPITVSVEPISKRTADGNVDNNNRSSSALLFGNAAIASTSPISVLFSGNQSIATTEEEDNEEPKTTEAEVKPDEVSMTSSFVKVPDNRNDIIDEEEEDEDEEDEEDEVEAVIQMFHYNHHTVNDDYYDDSKQATPTTENGNISTVSPEYGTSPAANEPQSFGELIGRMLTSLSSPPSTGSDDNISEKDSNSSNNTSVSASVDSFSSDETTITSNSESSGSENSVDKNKKKKAAVRPIGWQQPNDDTSDSDSSRSSIEEPRFDPFNG